MRADRLFRALVLSLGLAALGCGGTPELCDPCDEDSDCEGVVLPSGRTEGVGCIAGRCSDPATECIFD